MQITLKMLSNFLFRKGLLDLVWKNRIKTEYFGFVERKHFFFLPAFPVVSAPEEIRPCQKVFRILSCHSSLSMLLWGGGDVAHTCGSILCFIDNQVCCICELKYLRRKRF